MALNLSLNGWPPVASHMACVLVGVAMVHLTPPAADAGHPLKLPAQMATLPLKERTASAWQLQSAQRGQTLYLMRGEDERTCRLSQHPVLVLSTKQGYAVASSYRDTPVVVQALTATRTPATGVRLAAAAASSLPPLCVVAPKVNYGRS